jgi:hypothetical protein
MSAQKIIGILKRIYGLPASVTLVTQFHGWKLGKTDFAFLLTEMCKKYEIIDEFSSNTETDHYPLIKDFTNFDYWANHNSSRKMFIFDEVIESAQRRRAMSNINIEWVRRIPQLSKNRCHLVIVTQSIRLMDSAFLDWTFLRGVWLKKALKVVNFHNPHMFDHDYLFTNVPKTDVKFDPYQIASFDARGILKDDPNRELTRDEQIVLDFKKGLRPNTLAHKYGLGHESVLIVIRNAM